MIKILHLSDIHFGISDPDNEHSAITDGIVSSIKQHIKDNGAPDLCIFSGDITQRGSLEDFKRATIWFKKISSIVQCPFFIVPGNHEVERSLEDEDKALKIIGLRRSSYHDESAYQQRKEAVLLYPGLFTNFTQWHESLQQQGIEVLSDWSSSISICYKARDIRGLSVKLIGLNTAIMSCDNNDEGKLIADIADLNDCLGRTNPSCELVLVVGHHPIGSQSDEQWLVNWNAKKLEPLLLRSNGPHIYLHGHLHKASGVTLNISTGQSLTFFGAGACYQSKYSMKYAFYDVSLETQKIKPWTYDFDVDTFLWKKVAKGVGSEAVRSILPRSAKSTAAIAYANTLDATSRVVKQLYSKGLRHHITQIKYKYEIDVNGDTTVTQSHTIVAVDDSVHFWRWYFEGDNESNHIDYIEDLNIKLTSDEDNKVVYLPVTDEPRQKEIAVFFLPEIDPGMERTVSGKYYWPQYLPHLNYKQIKFNWEFLTAIPTATCEIDIEFIFSAEIGAVSCENRSTNYKKGTLSKSTENGKLCWRYYSPQAKLHNHEFEFVFNRERN